MINIIHIYIVLFNNLSHIYALTHTVYTFISKKIVLKEKFPVFFLNV